MDFPGWLGWAVAVAVLLAGCSKPAEGNEDAAGSPDNGMLRGVVVDEAIRPLPGVAVELTRPGSPAQTNVTDALGRFAFAGLTPGSYVVTARLDGYLDQTVPAEARPAADDPPMLNLVLLADVESIPYVVAVTFDGFIECGLRGGTGGVAACRVADSVVELSDNSILEMPLDPGAAWLQAELVWEPTQPLADYLGFYFTQLDAEGQASWMGIYPLNMGVSPLLLAVDADGVGHCSTCVEDPLDMAAWDVLQVTAMAGEMASTTPPTLCSPTGSPCLVGAGVVLNQPFQVFVHAFYRAGPAEGWRFTSDGPPPL